uniref:Uncharacterized protein n=1 Tax=Aegilops tauschii subsp. strangulata TaxID=200361 RepID=A0A453SPU2_AEGTS
RVYICLIYSDLLHVFPTFKILELGIVSHSVIIGLSLGVSQSPCTIKPLVAALSFHQFFEGFALGDCISQESPWGWPWRHSTTHTAAERWWWRAFLIPCQLVY